MQTWLSHTFNVIDVIMYLLQGPPRLDPKKKIEIKDLRGAYLRLAFANKVFCKGAIF